MVSLQEKLQKELTPELKREFRKYCLLLQGYSDSNSWVYECDFRLTDNIYWNDFVFYSTKQGVEMLPPIEEYFKKVIKYYIDTDELWEHIEREPETLVETGWLHFTIFPTQNKLQIEMEYDYYDNMGTTHEESIANMIELYSKGDEDNTQIQLLKWEKQGAIFTVKYEGSEWGDYIDDSCSSNIGITKTPEIIEHLSEMMIEEYEEGYHLENDGGSGEIKFDFKTDTVLMEHTQYNTSSTEVELAELNF
jgi:hypothetical protein